MVLLVCARVELSSFFFRELRKASGVFQSRVEIIEYLMRKKDEEVTEKDLEMYGRTRV